jgi:hypothetical protein
MNNCNYSPSIARISTPVDITKQAVGTGFIVQNTCKGDKSILFLTNAHVVAPGKIHNVELAWCHGEKLPANVVAICYQRDLALLKVSEEVWNKTVTEYVSDSKEAALIRSAPHLPFGTSEMLQPIGTKVYCQGHPLGLADQQVSWGKTRGVYNMPNGEQRILIQAPINHGNSGGPVFVDAESPSVIGISTMKLSGEQVEGEGGIITLMEIEAVLPSLMLEVKSNRNVNASELMAIIGAMMSGHGVQIDNPQAPGYKHMSWLSKNWEEFNTKWMEHAVGGTVSSQPRAFDAWMNRHVLTPGGDEFQYNGDKLLNMVIHMCHQDRYHDLSEYKSNVGGWREMRLAGEKHVVKLDLGQMMKTCKQTTKLLHPPIFGWENIQSVQTNDYKTYYNIKEENVNGMIVNTVLPKSLYELNGGEEGDLVYAFRIDKVGENKTELGETTMLDKEGKFSPAGTALGCRISLTTALHHIPWFKEGDALKHRVTLSVYRKDGDKTDVSFIVRCPTRDELPKMRQIKPFNNESRPPAGVQIFGIPMTQCTLNAAVQMKLMEYMSPKTHYMFKVIAVGGTRVMPGSTLTKLNGVDTSVFKDWNDFMEANKKFHALCKSESPPKYWTAEFERLGYKVKIINKIN